MEQFMNELMSDGEPLEKRERELQRVYKKNPRIVDDLFISLCGWSYATILNKSHHGG